MGMELEQLRKEKEALANEAAGLRERSAELEAKGARAGEVCLSATRCFFFGRTVPRWSVCPRSRGMDVCHRETFCALPDCAFLSILAHGR